jgi:hypothetical protein
MLLFQNCDAEILRQVIATLPSGREIRAPVLIHQRKVRTIATGFERKTELLFLTQAFAAAI